MKVGEALTIMVSAALTLWLIGMQKGAAETGDPLMIDRRGDD